jgi:hypothetical protein
MTARAHRTGPAALLTLALGVAAGCGLTGEPAAEKSPTVSVATPREALLQAVPDEKAPAYRFDIKGGVTPMSGVLDAPRKAVALKIVEREPDVGFTLTMNALIVDQRGWIKLNFKPANLPGLPKLPKKWLLLDPGRLSDQKSSPLQYGDETDPGYTSLLVQSAADLRETAKGRYAGTVDLTQATQAEIVDDKTLTALGAKAKAVPFTAAVDADGRLTSAVLKIPAAGTSKASTYQVTYSGFGSTATPAVPAPGEQTKATAPVYDLLNG